MPSQGPFNAGTVTSDASLPAGNDGGAWTDPTSAQGASDSVPAQGSGVANTVPSDHSIRIFDGAAYVGTDQAASAGYNLTTYTNHTFGSAVNDWGVALTPAKVNAAAFGFGISYKNGAAGTVFTRYLRVANLGFTIPSNARITGYTLVVRCAYFDGNGASFARGTKVHTPFGEVPIEKIKVGDMVDAHNKEGRVVTRPVTGIKTRFASDVRRLVAGGIEVFATPNEQFMVGPNQYKKLGKLKVGDTLYKKDVLFVLPVVITEIGIAAPCEVFSIEVSGEHTFFSGGIAVHNTLVPNNNIGEVDSVTATITYDRVPRYGFVNHNNPGVR